MCTSLKGSLLDIPTISGQTTNGSGHCGPKKRRLDTSIIAEENEAFFLDKYIGKFLSSCIFLQKCRTSQVWFLIVLIPDLCLPYITLS